MKPFVAAITGALAFLSPLTSQSATVVESKINIKLMVYEDGARTPLRNKDVINLYGERYGTSFDGGSLIHQRIYGETPDPYDQVVIRRRGHPDFVVNDAGDGPPLWSDTIIEVVDPKSASKLYARTVQHLYIGLPDIHRLVIQGLATETRKNVYRDELDRSIPVSRVRIKGPGEMYDQSGYPAEPFAIIDGQIDLVGGKIIADPPPPTPYTPTLMQFVPAGTFQMGDPYEQGEGDDVPAHHVYIDSFWMDRFEVTKALWDEVYHWALVNGYTISSNVIVGNVSGPNYPVCGVNWYDAVKWCNARSEKEGLMPVYYKDKSQTKVYRRGEIDLSFEHINMSNSGFRLPTEAEWEKAARGGLMGHHFPWPSYGGNYRDHVSPSYANYGASAVPVGSYAPNGYGLYDMAGDVFEWCWDWSDEEDGNWYSQPEATVANCLGPPFGPERTHKGGAIWWKIPFTLRPAYRGDHPPDDSDIWLGFRTVLRRPADSPPPPYNETNTYLVIDLSGGLSATNYPLSYLSSVPAGGWTDEYKTTKLVMRRIPAGTFTMGSPTSELGHLGELETQHEVTLTQPFYIGVFEVTQKQWERVMGTYPSWFANVTYRDSRPVERVSYYDIRENHPNNSDDPAVNWPSNSAVNANSFMGKLRAKTGLSTLDLPTESQWEYAGRAGTTTALNSGQNLTNGTADASLDVLGRYYYNHPGGYSFSSSVDTNGGTATVGSYQANAWGLYDIHGNVGEWCLDWYVADLGTSALTDPAGAASGSARVGRGGYWDSFARSCRSANRSSLYPNSRLYNVGFRLAMTLP